jgi:hypothetical protein
VDLLGIRPNYFENLGLASFQISRISRPRGPSAAGPKLFSITFSSAFLLESSQAARCKIYIWKSVDDFEKEGQEQYLANPAHENTASFMTIPDEKLSLVIQIEPERLLTMHFVWGLPHLFLFSNVAE